MICEIIGAIDYNECEPILLRGTIKTQDIIALQNKWKTIGFAPQSIFHQNIFFADTQQNVFDYRELDIDHTSNFEEALAKKYDIVPTKFYMIFGKEKCDITYATLPKDIKRKVDYTTISVVEIKNINDL